MKKMAERLGKKYNKSPREIESIIKVRVPPNERNNDEKVQTIVASYMKNFMDNSGKKCPKCNKDSELVSDGSGRKFFYCAGCKVSVPLPVE